MNPMKTQMAQQLTKENSVTILSNSIDLAQKRGAFLLQEASLLKKAVDFFNKDVKTKPDFGGSENPEVVAINLLLQGVQKAQSHKDCPFNLNDAALLFDIFEFLVKDGGKDVAQNVNLGGSKSSSSSSVAQLTQLTEEDEDEDDDEIRPITVSSNKGKGRN